MGHTNETQNLHLPQFISTDKPTFLGDINGAMQTIDSAYGTAIATATGAESTAGTAATAAATAVETANGATATAQQAATDASTATGVANTAADTANNAQSTAVLAKQTADAASAAVGDLTDLDTSVKTDLVSAVNEVNGKFDRGSVSVTADGVKSYAALLNELSALVDYSKITKDALLVDNEGYICHAAIIASARYQFSASRLASGGAIYHNRSFDVNTSASLFFDVNITIAGNTLTNKGASVPTNGDTITIYY